MTQEADFTLYTYFRSSCSARLRIALNLKKLSYNSVFVHLLKGEQHAEQYVQMNPSHSVPSLLHNSSTPGDEILITQSIAALEYLEEAYPEATPLLPPATDLAGRGAVRTLVQIIAADTQPVTNLRILSRISDLGGNREQWAKDLARDGLAAYEQLASKTAGRFSFGDSITLADVCLVPAVWGAARFGVDIKAFPVISKVYDEASKNEAFIKGHWKNQEDTPEELRG